MPNTYPLRALCWAIALLLLPGFLSAQLTIKVTSIPANTPASANIYIAGTFNGWNPGDVNMILTVQPNGHRTITLHPAIGPVRFKFTRGSWATVEGNANGGFQPDHVITYTGLPQTIEVAILSWEDLSNGNTGTTHVTILDNNFFMPELSRTRRIWLYLPPDYATSTKKYPVLYMHDGQNLFDPTTSFAGEWEVDESMDEMFAQGDYGCIIVGIDNGGVYRLDEYSAWINPLYGGGQGDEYMNFIANTLKPYIDSHYRTLPGRNYTGLMGSSMGGLVSMYGLIEHQARFSRAGIFSPAFWFAGDHSVAQILATGKRENVRAYFLCGGQEPAYVKQDMQEVADAMLDAGFSSDEIAFKVPADGQHSEWFWRREFPAAYKWLFGGLVSDTGEADADDTPAPLEVYPNPASDWIRVSGPEEGQPIQVQIVAMDGSLKHDETTQPGAAIRTGDLPPGFYALRVRTEGGNWQTTKMIRQ